MTIEYTKDGKCLFDSLEKSRHDSPVYVKKYFAEGLLDKIGEVCERYNIISRTNLQKSNIVMYDAPSYYYTFMFEDGTRITFGSDTECPAQWPDAHGEINELIKESENYGTDVEEEKVSSDVPGTPMANMQSGIMGGMMGYMETVINLKLADERSKAQSDTPSPASGWVAFCSQCGTQFKDGQRFCSECGAVRSRK